jgi:transposase-like protein
MTKSYAILKRARISTAKFRQILKYFALDIEATKIARLTGLNRNTINKYLLLIRKVMALECEQESPFSGEVEVDESFFGARRTKGKRGRGASGKTIVFGLLKRNGKVYTKIVPNCSRATLQAVIRGKVDFESTIHSDGWKGYNGLVDLGYKKHYRVQHGNDEFANKTSHINGIENFWGIAKMRLAKFRGLSKSTFYLHLKESEFRFNHRGQNLYKLLLKIIKKRPLN